MALFFPLSNMFLQYSFLLFSSSYLLYQSFALQKQLCDDGDRSSLLRFKQSFVFDNFSCVPSTKLSSWKVGDDCCSWDGVDCNNQTGRIISLDLSSSCLYGSINSDSPVFEIFHLRSLNLSSNNFELSRIPGGIRSLSELTHLDLSFANFSGQLPLSIGNLTRLKVLDLSENYFSGKIPFSFSNLLQLRFLALSGNYFSSGTLDWLGKLANLQILELEETNSYGPIPSSFRNLTQLVELWLPSNQLTGQIPSWLGNSTRLTTLFLPQNELQGPIPDSIFRLPNIQTIALHYNNLSGSLRFDSFLQSKYLSFLFLSRNHLTLVSNTTYMNGTLPRFRIIGLAGCNLREFPAFLRGQNELEGLMLSQNNIKGLVPNWIFSLERLKLLNLAYNFLNGFEQYSPSDTLPWMNLCLLDLTSNRFEGPLLIPPSSIEIYSVSQNKFNGDISSLFYNNLTSLSVLDLSDNNLSGNLPPGLGKLLGSSTLVLNLRNNSFSGKIPDNFASANCALKVMDFSQNKIEGKVPRSLTNCSKLELLSLEENEMKDVFPSWLAILPRLRILSLRSNKFQGAIGLPLRKFEFRTLQVIDLSDNNFTGKLPLKHIRNWAAMKTVDYDRLAYMEAITTFQSSGYKWGSEFPYFIRIVNKGTVRAYNRILEFFVVVDLSSNRFEGVIPEIIGTLKELQSLNLSNNVLTGHIPPSLGNLTKLEALDLSRNNLSGEIPIQLAFITFLAVFNVSHNSLTGSIPQGNQFETFENDSFSANPGLRGHPLSRKCGNTHETLPLLPSKDEDAESPFEFNWEIVLMGCGTGLVIGVAFGCAMDTSKYEWLVKKNFGRWFRSY